MSWQAQRWVYERLQGLTPTAKSILAYLAFRTDDAGRCWPAVETIAEQTELSVRTVQTNLRAFEVDGLLLIRERRGMSNMYVLTVPERDKQTVEEAPGGELERQAEGLFPDAPGVQITTPGVHLTTKNCRQMHPNSKEYTKENKIDPLNDEFEEFYQRYPRHEGRKPALEAYRKHRKRIAHTLIMAALNVRLKELLGREPKFRPLPASWLNSEPWSDNLTIEKGVSEQISDDDPRGWHGLGSATL